MTRQLTDQDDRTDFRCGVESLDTWFRTQVGQDVRRKRCVCYVWSPPEGIRGFYSLSAVGMRAPDLPDALRRRLNAGYADIPLILLGRLAIDERSRGGGMGGRLLVDALRRAHRIATETIGAVGVVTDPVDASAAAFYRHFGFVELPDSRRMIIRMMDLGAPG